MELWYNLFIATKYGLLLPKMQAIRANKNKDGTIR